MLVLLLLFTFLVAFIIFGVHLLFGNFLLHLLFLDDLLFAVLPSFLLLVDRPEPDVLDLELDAAELDDVVLPQLVVQFLLGLLETSDNKVHSLDCVCRQRLVLSWVRLGLIFYLVLGQEIVVFWHLWSF